MSTERRKKPRKREASSRKASLGDVVAQRYLELLRLREQVAEAELSRIMR